MVVYRFVSDSFAYDISPGEFMKKVPELQQINNKI